MIKLLATDLDGTLLEENSMTKRNRDAVYKLQKLGKLLVIATGRPYNGVKIIKDEYNIRANYYILLNGALIVDSLGSKIVQKIIKKDVIKKILSKINSDDILISVESGFNTYILSDGDKLPYPNKIRVDSIDEIEENISLISMYNQNRTIEEVEDFKNKINEEFKDEIIAFRNGIYIDIIPKGCSKGEGIKYLVEQEALNMKDVYTIGDSWNDVSMFDVTENSFTFDYAEEELKKYANYIVTSVAHCIEDYIL